MLIEFLEKALAIGADSVEIEYKDGREWIIACSGDVGWGIGCLDGEKARLLLKEISEFKKKQATIDGATYRLVFSRYESFGEWVHRIQMKPMDAAKAPRRRSARKG